jgi:hypothetical protein
MIVEVGPILFFEEEDKEGGDGAGLRGARAHKKSDPMDHHEVRPFHWGIVYSATRGRVASCPYDSFCSLSPSRGRSELEFVPVS